MPITDRCPASLGEKLESMGKILGEQNRIYTRLLEIARQKQQVIIQGDLAALNRLNQAEELLIREAGKLEAQRFELQSELAREWDLEPQELKLARFAECFGPAGEELMQRGEQLSRALDELHRVNQQNTDLIEHSLRHLEFNVSLLTQAGNSQGLYGQQGTEDPEPRNERPRIFDKKV